MAGVMMTGNEGKAVGTQTVPSIGGPATIVEGGHVDQLNSYPSYPAAAQVSLDGGAYPAGTKMSDSTPSDDIN